MTVGISQPPLPIMIHACSDERKILPVRLNMNTSDWSELKQAARTQYLEVGTATPCRPMRRALIARPAVKLASKPSSDATPSSQPELRATYLMKSFNVMEIYVKLNDGLLSMLEVGSKALSICSF